MTRSGTTAPGGTEIEAPALAVIVPCFNEERSLPHLVDRTHAALAAAGIRGEIVLVNDGSLDRTGAVIDGLAEQHDDVHAVHHPRNRGIVEGWRSGLAASTAKLVLTTDADLQYAPEDISTLYREARQGAWDLVQGWRQHRTEQAWLRDVLSGGLSVLLRWVFSMDLHDVKSGFVVYKREVFADILDFRMRYFSFQSLMTVAAHSKGYRIKQVPITFHERYAGQSFIRRPLIFSLKAATDIPKAIWEYRIGKVR